MFRSVTVRKLQSMSHPEVPTETFTLVGTLEFVPGSTTSWLFDMHDSTGVLRISRNCVTTRVIDDVDERIRNESLESTIECDVGLPPWKNGEYHRVYGLMTGHVFEALSIRPIRDMNELTMHVLECVYQDLKK